MSNNFIWPIDRTQSSANIPRLSGLRSDDHEEVLCISQSSSRLFSIISRTLDMGLSPLARDALGVFYSPSQLGWRMDGFMLSSKVFAWNEMQTASSRVWTRIADSISTLTTLELSDLPMFVIYVSKLIFCLLHSLANILLLNSSPHINSQIRDVVTVTIIVVGNGFVEQSSNPE